MKIKLEYVASFARAAQLIFDEHFDEVTTYDPDLAGTWEVDILVPAITKVEDMIVTLGLRKLSAEDTVKMVAFMEKETPLINDLEFSINKCLKAHTITDGVGAFNISELRKSIRDKNINAFNTAYSVCIGRVNANAAALVAKGFTVEKKNFFKGFHDSAVNMQNTKRALKLEIKDLSAANRLIVENCIAIVMMMVKSIFAYAKSVNDTDLMALATGKAILKSVVPTPVKKVRKKIVKATATVIYQRKIAANRTMQFTVKTKESILLGRSETIEGVPTATMSLDPERLVSVKKNEIPGKGNFVKLINPNFNNARVQVFVIVP